jgi:hypothetical protein
MPLYLDILIKILGIGGAMLFLLEAGREIGKHAIATDPLGSHQGLGPAEAGVFGLMGLIIALTFSGAASRFDQRRMLIIDEANAIGTAYLRVDLLPEEAQPPIRRDFRDYLEARIELYHSLADKKKTADIESKTSSLQLNLEGICSCKQQVRKYQCFYLTSSCIEFHVRYLQHPYSHKAGTSTKSYLYCNDPPGVRLFYYCWIWHGNQEIKKLDPSHCIHISIADNSYCHS